MKFITLLTAFSVTCAAFAQTDQNEVVYDQTKALILQKEYKAALAKIETIPDDSKEPAYYQLKSICYGWMKDYENEISTLNFGLDKYPHSSLLYDTRGEFFNRVQDHELAVRDFGQAVKFEERDSLKKNYLERLAWAQYNTMDYNKAYESAMISYQIDSMYVPTLNTIAMTLEVLDSSLVAIGYLKKAYAIDTTSFELLANIGFTYQRIGEYELSLEYFNQANQKKPNDALVLNNRSYTLMKLGRLKDALADVNASIKLWEYNSYAYRNRALIYLEMGKTRKACADIQQALQCGFTKQYGDEVLKLGRRHCN